MVKKLYVMRHSKAKSSDHGIDDHDRPLTKQGINHSRIVAKHALNDHFIPETVLVSDALRTTQTAREVATILCPDVEPSYQSKLYLATAGEMLKHIHATDDTFTSLLIIAHNPGVFTLCRTLIAGGDPASLLALQGGVNTSGFSAISLPAERWSDVTPNSGTLERYLEPQLLPPV